MSTCGSLARAAAALTLAVLATGLVGPIATAATTSAHASSIQAVQTSAHAGAPSAARPAVQDPAPTPTVATPSPKAPATPGTPNSDGGITVDINGVDGKPSTSLVMILTLTALSVAPALLLMTTSFTKIFVVLSITRNALGLTSTPPNQVIAGLSLFLSLFIMGPVISDVNAQAVQPYLKGTMTQSVAIETGAKPLSTFMLSHTRDEDLALMTRAAKRDNPATREETPFMTLVPAFVLSELRAAFIIGFVIFIPFLVIDLVVAAVLMSMGMMMLPPVTVSLPFKLLLFVLVDGWAQVITALVGSYQGG